MKKTGWIVLAVVAAIVIFIAGMLGGTYNSLVDKEMAVESKQAAILTQLQRRADLIPNFVSTVKGYTEYEKSTLQAVTDARAAVSKAQNAGEQAKANDQLNKAVDIWVNAITEAYPDLKANTQFTALQDELSGTENRIATARHDYNEAVKVYNSTIRRFPNNLFAGMFGFEKAEFFEASENAQQVPEVSF